MVLFHTLDGGSEGATEPSMVKDNWDQLKSGVSKNMHCVMVMMTRTNIMMMRMRMCGVQNVEQVMREKFTYDVFEEGEREEGDNTGKGEPSAAILSALEGLIS
jgi:hypothetical protein